MASCERCWYRSRGNVDRYHELLRTEACTPEQQAGPDALWCPECGRRTWHQYAGVCTVDPRHGQAAETAPRENEGP